MVKYVNSLFKKNDKMKELFKPIFSFLRIFFPSHESKLAL